MSVPATLHSTHPLTPGASAPDATVSDASGADAPAADLVDAVDVEMPRRLRILVVDDDRTLREGCSNILQLDGHHVTAFSRGEEAIEAAQRTHFDIALVDLYMTPVSGMDVLRGITAADPNTLVVVMTGNPTVASSLDALRAGAWDYLPKPFSASHLQVLVGRAAHVVVRGGGVERESRQLREPSEPRPDARAVPAAVAPRESGSGAGAPAATSPFALIGESSAFRQAITMARRVAPTDASVMIIGESGTGKELIAQFVHQHSRRASRKLVAVNCAALPGALLESEMFGHKKGAFTGADRDKPGLLEVANGGTLFLDELGEMPMALQAKLLRVLQDGVVRRVGSEKQDAVVDVRFIAATNRDPAEAIRSGLLREDLFYRLCVVPIKLPPLRQRPDDIATLARHFLTHFWARHRKPGAAIPQLDAESIAFLQSRPWRGNVRELQNVIEHVSVIAEPGRVIRPDDIPLYDEGHDGGTEGGNGTGFPTGLMSEAFHSAKDRLVAMFEREYLTRLAARTAGNMSKAARLAGVDRTTLYRLMEKHGLRRDEGSNGLASVGSRLGESAVTLHD
jgi:DNA-binding NtrC family response regulator